MVPQDTAKAEHTHIPNTISRMCWPFNVSVLFMPPDCPPFLKTVKHCLNSKSTPIHSHCTLISVFISIGQTVRYPLYFTMAYHQQIYRSRTFAYVRENRSTFPGMFSNRTPCKIRPSIKQSGHPLLCLRGRTGPHITLPEGGTIL